MKMKLAASNKKNEELERCKYENSKLRIENYRFKKHIALLMRLNDRDTINEWNFSPSPQIPRRAHRSAKSHRHGRTKLSSTRIQPTSQNSADISSIHGLMESTNNGTNGSELVTSVHTDCAESTIISPQSSISLASDNELYKTALASNIQNSLLIRSDITNDESIKNDWNFSPSPQIPLRSNRWAKNHCHDRTELFQSDTSYAPVNISLIDGLMEITNDESTNNGTNGFNIETSEIYGNAESSIISSTSSSSQSSISLASENEPYKTALASNSQNSIIIRSDITNDDWLDAVRDASQFNHIDSIQIQDPSNQFPLTYCEKTTNVYTAPYIIGIVKFLSKKYASDFSVDQFLPQELFCECCLCQLRVKNADTFEFCINQHPLQECCKRGQPKRKINHHLRYQMQPLCDECMSSMTMKSKKNKSGEYRCCFTECNESMKTLAKFRVHIKLQHLHVKNFICSLCDKDFYSKSGLKKHERHHH